jgi:O-antigen/teichoic acid export membrane protein
LEGNALFDRAAAYSLIYRGWQAFAGAISLALVVHLLHPAEQGLYFTFASLIGFQAVVELGLSYVSTQFAGHEMVDLQWTSNRLLSGSTVAKLRLRELFRFATIWAIVSGFALALVLLPIGNWLLQSRPEVAQVAHWRPAWTWLVVATALFLCVSPGLAILEGCGRVAEVARFRTLSDITAYVAFWTLLVLGYGLLAFPALVSVRVLMSIVWLARFAGKAWVDLPRSGRKGLDWRHEVWPMQWRVGVSWAAGFGMFQLVNPVAYRTLGPVVAGKVGVAIAAASAITALATATVNARVPALARFIAQRRYQELDRYFARISRSAIGIAATVGAGFLLLIAVSSKLQLNWTSRIAALEDSTLLVLTAIANVAISALAIYLRAHKREPLMTYSIVSAAITPLALWVGATTAGLRGLVIAYASTTSLLGLAWVSRIFVVKRRVWHEMNG